MKVPYVGGGAAVARDLAFVECDTCRAKSGTPPLCMGCLHNRLVIEAFDQASRKPITMHDLRENICSSPIRTRTWRRAMEILGHVTIR